MSGGNLKPDFSAQLKRHETVWPLFDIPGSSLTNGKIMNIMNKPPLSIALIALWAIDGKKLKFIVILKIFLQF